MSEQSPNPSSTPEAAPPSQSGTSNFKTILFMVVLSFVCALILSILASVLAEPKAIAKDLDRSRQMMIAAKILNHNGNFLMRTDEGKYVIAKYASSGKLVPGNENDIATRSQLLDIYKKRLIPMLVNKEGNLTTFKKANINEVDYLNDYKKTGYYKQPLMLVYKILANPPVDDPSEIDQGGIEGYVIPVNGFGLWDAIYGYLAIQPNGDSVIGITWYDQKETPGLGANISESSWQSQFSGKLLFQESAGGKTNFKTSPLGIVVVKGKVAEVLGDTPKAKSAVDGMAGATLTGNGVTDAYKDVLAPYRPFLMKLHTDSDKNPSEKPATNEKEKG